MATADEIAVVSYILGVALLVNLVIILHFAVYRLGLIHEELKRQGEPQIEIIGKIDMDKLNEKIKTGSQIERKKI